MGFQFNQVGGGIKHVGPQPFECNTINNVDIIDVFCKGMMGLKELNQLSWAQAGPFIRISRDSSAKQREKKKVFDQLTSHEEEIADNICFEDPFKDEYENEEIDDKMETDVKENGENSKMKDDNGKQQQKQQQQRVQSWNPLTSAPLDPGTELEIDEEAYKMHHSLTPEWPALSFDILRPEIIERGVFTLWLLLVNLWLIKLKETSWQLWDYLVWSTGGDDGKF